MFTGNEILIKMQQIIYSPKPICVQVILVIAISYEKYGITHIPFNIIMFVCLRKCGITGFQ
jgi:hypothetical protein